MKKLVLDHLERWFASWLIMGFGYLFIGAGELHMGKFPSSTLMFLLWLGVFQLNHDLQRKHFLALFTLPVTPRQIGQAWWFVSVGLPALLLAATSGIGLLVLDYSKNAQFPVALYLENCVINVSFLAVSFFGIIALPNRRPQGTKEYLEAIGAGAIFIYCIGELVRFPKIKDSPEATVFFIVGIVFTIAGWIFAGPLILRRKGFRPAVASPQKKEAPYGNFQKFGGIPFLFTTQLIRTLLIALAISVPLVLPMVVQGKPFHFDFLFIGSNSVLPFVIILQAVWILRQSRFLRTLPLSTGQLAMVLVALPVVLSLMFAVCLTALAIPLEGATKSMEIPVTCLMSGAVITLVIPIAAIFGLNQLVLFIIYFFGLLGTLMYQLLIMPKVSLLWNIAGSCLLIVASFLLTKKGLTSSNAYRVSSNLAGVGWIQQR